MTIIFNVYTNHYGAKTAMCYTKRKGLKLINIASFYYLSNFLLNFKKTI